jgi:hypothetical protein
MINGMGDLTAAVARRILDATSAVIGHVNCGAPFPMLIYSDIATFGWTFSLTTPGLCARTAREVKG